MNVVVAVSTVVDGDMSLSSQLATNNRVKFLDSIGVKLQDTTSVRVTYDGTDYRRYKAVNSLQKGDGMIEANPLIADALITRETGHALFLTLADCVGAAIFDPINSVLMLTHLGRHSVEQNGGKTSIDFLINNYGSKPENLMVWLTPAPGQKSFPVFAMDNLGLKELVLLQLQSAGVNPKNISDNSSDTTLDENYFSHSEFLKGNRKDDGRYAIVAVIKD